MDKLAAKYESNPFHKIINHLGECELYGEVRYVKEKPASVTISGEQDKPWIIRFINSHQQKKLKEGYRFINRNTDDDFGVDFSFYKSYSATLVKGNQSYSYEVTEIDKGSSYRFRITFKDIDRLSAGGEDFDF